MPGLASLVHSRTEVINFHASSGLGHFARLPWSAAFLLALCAIPNLPPAPCPPPPLQDDYHRGAWSSPTGAHHPHDGGGGRLGSDEGMTCGGSAQSGTTAATLRGNQALQLFLVRHGSNSSGFARHGSDAARRCRQQQSGSTAGGASRRR